MGIVNQVLFETQLQAYLDGSTSGTEVAWHALRNAIYAAGSRIYLSETRTSKDANQVAWGYFENALALHTETLLFQTSITSVQALTIMVCILLPGSSLHKWLMHGYRRIFLRISEVLVSSTCSATTLSLSP